VAQLLRKDSWQAAATLTTKENERRKEMRKLAIAFAMILGLNMISSIVQLSVPMSYAQENPQPEPEKPGKPDSE